MISPEWAKRLDFMEHEVDLKLNVLQRRLRGQELNDWILWKAELADTDIDKWASLW